MGKRKWGTQMSQIRVSDQAIVYQSVQDFIELHQEEWERGDVDDLLLVTGSPIIQDSHGISMECNDWDGHY